MCDNEFSSWQTFPDPRKKGYLHAPFSFGVYELRRVSTKQKVLFGRGKNLSRRMTSLLPAPWGQGNRNNTGKITYCWEHLADLEYRTAACDTYAESVALEAKLKKTGNYIFSENKI